MADGDDPQVEAILASARAQRPATPRWLWITAGVIGIACTIAFIVAMLATGEPSPPPGPGSATPRGGLGFGTGLAIGVAAGVAIGFAIARQLRGHSSRNRP